MPEIKELLTELPYGPAPEDASLAAKWLDEHHRSFGCYIGGDWMTCPSTFASINPADGTELAQIGQADDNLVNQAVEGAQSALSIWQGLGDQRRSELLYALARQIQKHARLFSVLETLDNGKPIRETRDIDIPLVARHFYYHAGMAKICTSQFPGYRPVGVCGQIIPWNFPLLMLAWKIAPALAAGNTVVLKPAEFTSLTALLFAEICQNVGMPAGVVNIITGDGAVGKSLVTHQKVDKIAFTGSTEVGRHIRRATAGSPKKLSLELGGKSPFIVFDDADLDSAVEGLVDAIWFNQGQVCCAGSRLLVQESIAETLYAKIRTRMATLRIGNPLDKAVDIGAIVDRTQLERIGHLVYQGVDEGATIFQSPCDLPKDGFYFPPTLLTNVEPAATVAQEEIFGPVLVAMTFRTPAEAVALANNTAYGLAGSVWTQNIDIAHDIAAQVKAGAIWINCTNQFDASAGFGGYRESGFGREGGSEGMYEYLKPLLPTLPASPKLMTPDSANQDRTHKLYIGGKQVRPDGGYSFIAQGYDFALANRKDVRNAVEAAATAQPSWAAQSAFLRTQILYYLAENLRAAQAQFAAAGVSDSEFNNSIELITHYAAVGDKYDGSVHQVPLRALVYTRNEPIGVCASFAPHSQPLLGLLATTMPLVAMGNAVIAIPSEINPLPAVELVRVMEASDVPAGVFNLLTAPHADLEKTVADHHGIDAVWHFSGAEGGKVIQDLSAGNLKQTWCVTDEQSFNEPHPEFLRRAVQVKNIWTPYGA